MESELRPHPPLEPLGECPSPLFSLLFPIRRAPQRENVDGNLIAKGVAPERTEELSYGHDNWA